MVTILEKRADKACEEGRACLVDPFPDAVRYVVRAGGSGASGFCERRGDLVLTYREVIGEGGEVDVCYGRGRGDQEEVVKEGGVDTFRGVLFREGREAGLLPVGGELFRLPH